MKIVLTIGFIILTNITLYSQEDIIDEIKGQYYLITENTEDYFKYHDLTMNYILPAVGETTKTIRFYHVSEQADPERDPYDLDFTLLKVEIKFNVSASSFFTYEYLYNYRGQLIFYFDKVEGEYENYQKKYYYDNEKLIKCIVKGTDEDDVSYDYSRTNNYSQSDLTNSKSGTKKAAEYMRIFKIFGVIDKVD